LSNNSHITLANQTGPNQSKAKHKQPWGPFVPIKLSCVVSNGSDSTRNRFLINHPIQPFRLTPALQYYIHTLHQFFDTLSHRIASHRIAPHYTLFASHKTRLPAAEPFFSCSRIYFDVAQHNQGNFRLSACTVPTTVLNLYPLIDPLPTPTGRAG